MSTALGCCWGEILDSYGAMTCIAHLGREAAMIIEKTGVRPKKIFGFQPLVGHLGFLSQKEMNNVRFYSILLAPLIGQYGSGSDHVRVLGENDGVAISTCGQTIGLSCGLNSFHYR